MDDDGLVAEPPEGLGAIVLGPVIVARAPGISVGFRCIYGYPSGLLIPTVLRARGVQAEAAARSEAMSRTRPLFAIQADGRRDRVFPVREETSSGEDVFDQEAIYWVTPLPADRELVLVIAWPEAGLPEQRSRLTFVSTAPEN